MGLGVVKQEKYKHTTARPIFDDEREALFLLYNSPPVFRTPKPVKKLNGSPDLL